MNAPVKTDLPNQRISLRTFRNILKERRTIMNRAVSSQLRLRDSAQRPHSGWGRRQLLSTSFQIFIFYSRS